MRRTKAIALSVFVMGLILCAAAALLFPSKNLREPPQTGKSVPPPTSVPPSTEMPRSTSIPPHRRGKGGKVLSFGLGGGELIAPNRSRAEITKGDCERLQEGQLLFNPSSTMKVGQPYMISARLSRDSTINIAEGLLGSEFTIVTETVSCKVSVSLDAQEPSSFMIEKIPDGRKDEQILEPNSFSQWDWRVTPKKRGTLHLLLYVTPMLYVDGIGEQLKQFQQPPKVITVSPDYLYESKTFVKDNWAIVSGLLTAVVIPLFLWFRQGIVSWFDKRFDKGGSSKR